MFAGFSICSHVVAVTECNGDLRSFLDAARAKCTPNLTAIASQGLPKGAGRKGGVPKRKRKIPVPVESRSVWPCLVGIAGGASSTSSVAENCGQSQLPTVIPALDPTQDAVSQCTQGEDDLESLVERLTGNAGPVQLPLTSDSACSSFSGLQQLPSMNFSSSALSATSQGQVVLGNFNIHPPSVLQSVSNMGNPTPHPSSVLQSISNLGNSTPSKNSKPFTLKLRTKQIKVCQSCRKGYEGENDTLGLVLAHPERKLISNPITGVQFWGKECNSHYRASLSCLKKASESFQIEIPQELVPKLTIFQKVPCLQVPQ